MSLATDPTIPMGAVPSAAVPEVPRRGPLARWFGPLVHRRTWLDTLHLLLDLVAGVLWGSAVLSLIGSAFGLLITLLGIPLLVFTIFCGRIVGIAERWRLKTFLGVDLPGHPMPVLEGTFWTKLKTLLTDGPGWKGLIYGVVCLPWFTITFTVAVTLWATALGLVTAPAWAWYADPGPAQLSDTYRLTGWGAGGAAAGAFVIGLVLLAVTPRVLRALCRADVWLARTLLAPDPNARLAQRVEELTVSRDASVDSAAVELRRIERDLHDGAQQRLVALAMDLGLARERMERDGADPAATEAVARAHDEAKAAIGELRDLVRGIHPTVLTDRGLDAALSALIARSPVPVRLTVDLPERPPAAVEATAYFVVAEALTNVAKHSRATRATVAIARVGDRLAVEVFDDGVGGAVALPGSGLAGLHDRVAAAEGTWRFTSPEGGPTLLSVELPCAS